MRMGVLSDHERFVVREASDDRRVIFLEGLIREHSRFRPVRTSKIKSFVLLKTCIKQT